MKTIIVLKPTADFFKTRPMTNNEIRILHTPSNNKKYIRFKAKPNKFRARTCSTSMCSRPNSIIKASESVVCKRDGRYNREFKAKTPHFSQKFRKIIERKKLNSIAKQCKIYQDKCQENIKLLNFALELEHLSADAHDKFLQIMEEDYSIIIGTFCSVSTLKQLFGYKIQNEEDMKKQEAEAIKDYHDGLKTTGFIPRIRKASIAKAR